MQHQATNVVVNQNLLPVVLQYCAILYSWFFEISWILKIREIQIATIQERPFMKIKSLKIRHSRNLSISKNQLYSTWSIKGAKLGQMAMPQIL